MLGAQRPLLAQRALPALRVGVTAEGFLPERPGSRDIRLATVVVEIEYRLFRRLWLRGSLGPLLARGNQQIAGRVSERSGIAPYLEVGGGLLRTTDRFPPNGTPWNVSYRLGAGLDIALRGDVRLAIGFRRVHVSHTMKRPRNPTYNGDGFAVGLSW